MRPEDLPLLPTVSTPRVHPDGTWGVVAVTYPNLDADAYVGQLWRIDLTGLDAPRRLTRGFRDTAPRFSPDGALLGFLRATPDGPPQLHVIPATGGEPVQVTDAKLGVAEYVFSPDGRRVAFVARVPEEGRYGTLDGVAAAAEDPRRITTLKFQSNGLGWTNDRRRHLFVADVPDPCGDVPVKPVGRAAKALGDAKPALVPTATQLTDDDTDHAAPVFTPDGTAVLVASAKHAEADSDIFGEMFRVPVDGTGRPTAAAAGLNAYEACFAADGATLFLLGADLGETRRDFVGRLGGVWALPAAGGVPERLTDAETVQVEHAPTPYGTDGVLTTCNDRGTYRALTAGADGTVTVWPSGDTSILDADALPGDPTRLFVAVSTPEAFGEAGILHADGRLEILTDFSGRLRAADPVAAPRELTATASDGYPVHGWVYLPEGPGPHPVLLNIHGGPHSSYGPAFFDEFQVATGAGYAVVACNPRGSGGYGEHHGRVIREDLGNLDAADVLTFLDHALAEVPGLDAARVGVMGGSYGGYLTAWLIGHTDRFAAAIVERGYLDPPAFVGSSDIGWFFSAEYHGPQTNMVAQSPQEYAQHVTTPTLVLHSEQDLRCPLGQALRYYTTLKQNGVDAELLVFPGENHELSRSGTPHHRLERFRAILDWWARHLPVTTDGGAGSGTGTLVG